MELVWFDNLMMRNYRGQNEFLILIKKKKSRNVQDKWLGESNNAVLATLML